MSKPLSDFQPDNPILVTASEFSDTEPLVSGGRGCVVEVFGGDTATLVVEFLGGNVITYDKILPEYYQFPFRVRSIKSTGSDIGTATIIAG